MSKEVPEKNTKKLYINENLMQEFRIDYIECEAIWET